MHVMRVVEQRSSSKALRGGDGWFDEGLGYRKPLLPLTVGAPARTIPAVPNDEALGRLTANHASACHRSRSTGVLSRSSNPAHSKRQAASTA